MIVIVMGVTGAGKTTVGRLLAEQLGWEFADADDFHPPSNVEKIRRGISLTDDDRKPWLARSKKLPRRMPLALTMSPTSCGSSNPHAARSRRWFCVIRC